MTDKEWIAVADVIELVRAELERSDLNKFGWQPAVRLRRWYKKHQQIARGSLWCFWSGGGLLLRASEIRTKLIGGAEPIVHVGGEITADDWNPPLPALTDALAWYAQNPDEIPASDFRVNQVSKRCPPSWEWSEDGSLTIIKDYWAKLAGGSFTEATGVEANLLDCQYQLGIASPAWKDEQPPVTKLSQSAVDKAAVSFADGRLTETEVFERATSSLGARPTQGQWREAWRKVSPDQKLSRGRPRDLRAPE